MKWVIEALLFGLYLAFGLSWLGSISPPHSLSRPSTPTTLAAARLISAVSLAGAVVPILAGWLGARVGLRWGIAVGAVLCASAVFTPWVSSLSAALALRFLFGLGGGIVATLMAPMTMAWFPARDWALLNGFNNVSVNVGITLAMYGSLPLSQSWGWRNVLTGYGGIAALLAGLWILLGREGQTVTPSAGSPAGPSILKQGPTWWMIVGFAGPLASYLALNSWLSQHLVQTLAMTPEQASQVVGYFNLVGLPIAPLGGWVTTRLGLRRPLVLACGLLLPLASLGLIWGAHPYLWATLAGCAFQFYVSPFFTIPMELPQASPASVGMMIGVILSVAYLISFGSPMAVGWLRDLSGSYAQGLSLFAALSGSLAVGAWFLPETGPRRSVHE